MNEIKPDMIIKTVDGPSHSPNFKRTIRVHRKDTRPGFWVCSDFITGQALTMHESKLIQSLKEQNNGESQP